MGIIERIKEIEAEMARTQKNKATGFFYIYFILKKSHGALIGI
jgi:ribosome-interacting GTPase 1